MGIIGKKFTEISREPLRGDKRFRFLCPEDMPSEQLAPPAAVHFPFFGFHSRAIFFACSTCAGVIILAMPSRFLAAPSFSLASV